MEAKKVLIISGLPGEVISSTARRYGAAGYLEKPYSPQELVKKVAELFSGSDVPAAKQKNPV